MKDVSDSKDNGYIPTVFVFNPLPYRDPGEKFMKTIRDTTFVLMSQLGCPYGKTGRTVLSLITTEAVRKQTPHIELGSLAETFRKLDLAPRGGPRGTIKPVTDQFHRLANTHVDLSRKVSGSRYRGVQEVHFSFADTLSLYWNTKDSLDNMPTLFENYLQLSVQCYDYITAHAVPILLGPYFAIQSPREQDLYAWLARRLWNLETEQLVAWQALYEQFGPLDVHNRPKFRKEVAAYLLDIRANIYPAARVEVIADGLVLRPSPPLVEPNSRDPSAGYLP